MKVTEERLVIVEATRREWFDLFAKTDPRIQEKYLGRFRALICADDPPGETGFRVSEWTEIAASDPRLALS